MTKKQKLVWRLGKLPTVEELQVLLKTSIITQDEAREILFSSETVEDRDKKGLQSEIKFLRELVEKLSKGNNTRIVEVIREIEKPVYIEKYERYPWYQPYYTWCGSYTNGTTDYVSANTCITSNSANDSTCMVNMASNTANFSDINTF